VTIPPVLIRYYDTTFLFERPIAVRLPSPQIVACMLRARNAKIDNAVECHPSIKAREKPDVFIFKQPDDLLAEVDS